MDFEEWEASVAREIRDDSLWKMKAYRLALFLGDLGWEDATALMKDRRTFGLSDPMHRAVGSTSANIAEGYSRATGRDRAHFYEYALGSARESRDWYHKGRHVLGNTVTAHRLQILSEIIRLLLTTVPQQRGAILREDSESYSA
jgi:four helix bundle protein